MSASASLQLPYLAPAQSQKHVTVNESLRRLDAIVQLSVVSQSVSAEPGAPSDGDCYILPAGKTGANWGAMSNFAVAYYVDGAWSQLTPREGWRAHVNDENRVWVYDGAAWAGLARSTDIREKLAAARTYYVRTDGSDANAGLANTAGGAFRTVQAAIDCAAALDSVIYDVTIQIAAGTYAAPGLTAKTMSGDGLIIIVGDETTPGNVVLENNSASAQTSSLYALATKTRYHLRGVRLVYTGGGTGFGLRTTQSAAIFFQNVDFGTGFTQQIRSADYGYIEATGNYTVSAGASNHWVAVCGQIRVQSRTITITGTPAFAAAFANAQDPSLVIVTGNTFSGSATGVRYSAGANGVIRTGGGGASYLPGNAAGSVSDGGVYV